MSGKQFIVKIHNSFQSGLPEVLLEKTNGVVTFSGFIKYISMKSNS